MILSTDIILTKYISRISDLESEIFNLKLQNIQLQTELKKQQSIFKELLSNNIQKTTIQYNEKPFIDDSNQSNAYKEEIENLRQIIKEKEHQNYMLMQQIDSLHTESDKSLALTAKLQSKLTEYANQAKLANNFSIDNKNSIDKHELQGKLENEIKLRKILAKYLVNIIRLFEERINDINSTSLVKLQQLSNRISSLSDKFF